MTRSLPSTVTWLCLAPYRGVFLPSGSRQVHARVGVGVGTGLPELGRWARGGHPLVLGSDPRRGLSANACAQASARAPPRPHRCARCERGKAVGDAPDMSEKKLGGAGSQTALREDLPTMNAA
jgi:hypothetical protein